MSIVGRGFQSGPAPKCCLNNSEYTQSQGHHTEDFMVCILSKDIKWQECDKGRQKHGDTLRQQESMKPQGKKKALP